MLSNYEQRQQLAESEQGHSKVLFEGTLERKTGKLSSKKIFCVLLNNDATLYYTDSKSVGENESFVNPYREII